MDDTIAIVEFPIIFLLLQNYKLYKKFLVLLLPSSVTTGSVLSAPWDLQNLLIVMDPVLTILFEFFKFLSIPLF